MNGEEAKAIVSERLLAAKRFAYLKGGTGAKVKEERWFASPNRTDMDRPFARSGLAMVQRSFGNSAGSNWLQQMFLNLGGNEEVTRPYIESPWVFSCISARVRAEMKTKQRFRMGPDDDDEPIELKDPRVRDLATLLRKPNPNLKGGELRSLMTAYEILDGESFLFLLASNAQGQMVPVPAMRGIGPNATIPMPEEVWIVRGKMVEMDLDEDTQLPKTLHFHTKKGKVEFPSHAVAQVRLMNPDNPFRGVGPMQAALRAIQQDFQAERFDEALLANGGQPGGVFQAKTPGPVPEPVKEEIRRSYLEQHAKPQQDRLPMVLGGNLDYRALAHSPREMELLEKRLANKRSTLAVLGTPSLMISHTEDVQNRSVAEAAERAFWMNTVGPSLDWREEQLNEGLIHRIEGYEDVWLYHDRSSIDVLKPDISSMIADATKLWLEGGRTWRECADLVGIPYDEQATPGLDERYIPSGQIPAEVALEVARGHGQGPGNGSDGARAIAVRAAEIQGGTTTEDAEPEIRAEEVPDSDPAPELSEGEAAWLKAFNEDARAAYFERFEKALESLDKRMSEAVQPELTRYLRDVQRKIKETANKDATLELASPEGFERGVEMAMRQTTADIDRQLLRLLRVGIDRYERAFAKAYKSPMNSTWDNAAEGLAEEIGAEGFLDHASPAALRYLKNKPIRLAEGVYSRFSVAIKEALMTTMATEGVNSGTLSARLEAVLGKANQRLNKMAGGIPSRADRIARTENTAIAGRARAEEMKRDDIRKHAWVANPPGSGTRDDHIELDGRIRVVGKSFGFNLRWPGDSRASASQVVECRCTTAPVPRDQ